MRRILHLALVLSLALAPHALAQLRGKALPEAGGPEAAWAGDPGPLVPFLDGCSECDIIYAGDCSNGLWKIDTSTGVSTFLGAMPSNMFDIGMSSDGRLFGMTGFGTGYLLSTCNGTGPALASAPPGNGLAGDLASNDLFSQGPPLSRFDTTAFTTTTVGGAFGGAPPLWCGFSSGDLAMDPATGLLFSALGGCGCSGDALVTIDPTTGNAVAQVGCIRDSAGVPFGGVFGLAFDSRGHLWGGLGSFAPLILDIDPATGIATRVPITGGYQCTYGMASVPCPVVGPSTCEPLTQGFWKRVCERTHPSGEHERLPDYLRCIAATRTFRTVTSVAEACDRLHPYPTNDKCEQAEAQLMALVMNICSGRLGADCCVSIPGESVTTAGEARDLADSLLASGTRTFRDCVRAQSICDSINTAAALCATTTTSASSSARTLADGPAAAPRVTREPRPSR